MIGIEAPVSSSGEFRMGNDKHTIDNESASNQKFGNYVNLQGGKPGKRRRLMLLIKNWLLLIVIIVLWLLVKLGPLILMWVLLNGSSIASWSCIYGHPWFRRWGYKFCHGSSWRYKESLQQWY